jgi:hypothetical protein
VIVTSPADQAIDPAARKLIWVLAVGGLAPVLDTAIVNVALAALGRALHVSVASSQWTITGSATGPVCAPSRRSRPNHESTAALLARQRCRPTVELAMCSGMPAMSGDAPPRRGGAVMPHLEPATRMGPRGDSAPAPTACRGRSAAVVFVVGNVVAKARRRSLVSGDGFDAGQVGHELAGCGARASATRRAARR